MHYNSIINTFFYSLIIISVGNLRHGQGVELECTVQLLPQCVTFRPNLCTRNFARYMLRGCSTGRRKSEGMSQKLNREIGQSLISL
jgi:hypothetical protein